MHRNVSNVWWLAAVLGLALAGCGSDSTAPSGRPAAGQIAFTTDRDGNVDIYLMHADGSGVTRLTNNPAGDFWPVWSSDGTTELYATARDPWEEEPLRDEALLAGLSRLRDDAIRMLSVEEREIPNVDIQQEIRRQLEAIGYF